LSTQQGDKLILDTPAPSMIVTGLGDSSVNLEMRFWTEDPLMKYSLLPSDRFLCLLRTHMDRRHEVFRLFENLRLQKV